MLPSAVVVSGAEEKAQLLEMTNDYNMKKESTVKTLTLINLTFCSSYV